MATTESIHYFFNLSICWPIFQLCGNFSLRQTGKELDTVEEDT